jgi:N-acetylmuramoyl-L-alanine amidase
MQIGFGASLGAATLVLAATATLALGSATPVTASDVAEPVGLTLPQSVMDQALAEERARPEFVSIPDTPAADSLSDRGPAINESLSQLVSRHGTAPLADAQAECLAGAVYFESKSEPLDGQLAVAQVIMNRASSGRFPGSLCGVVKQRGQFSFIRGNAFPPINRASADWREAVGVSHVALKGLKSSSVGKALFFHARHVSPGWKLQRIGAVGNHIFYR